MMYHRPSRSTSAAQAFTLVELLVVIGIIALLISILMPALNKARDAAVTVSCLAKMRQLNTAVQMYGSANRGFFPPIMEAWPNSGPPSWAGGPCIFPIDTSSTRRIRESGYLSPYLGTGKPANFYVCPALTNNITNATNGQHSYKYNRYLGGMPDNWWALPDETYSWDTGHTWRYCRPWQIGKVRQPSNFAVFIEDIVVSNFYGGGGNALWFRTDQNAEKNGSAPMGGPYASPNSFQAVSHTLSWHNRKRYDNIPGTIYPKISSTMNVAFADGSARSIFIKHDRFPVRCSEIWVRPERPGYTW